MLLNGRFGTKCRSVRNTSLVEGGRFAQRCFLHYVGSYSTHNLKDCLRFAHFKLIIYLFIVKFSSHIQDCGFSTRVVNQIKLKLLKTSTEAGPIDCLSQLLSAFLGKWVGLAPHSGICQVHA